MIPPTPGQRRLATATVVALMTWLAVWYGLAEPPGAVPWLLVILLWAPWLPVLPMLVRGRRKGCAWGSVFSVLYAGLALTELIANPGERIWAAGAFGLSLAVMGILIRYSRRWPG